MSKQWKCPECGCKNLYNDKYGMGSTFYECLDCSVPYGKKTIQALVGLSQPSTAPSVYTKCDCSSTCRAMTHHLFCDTLHPLPKKFTTSPPWFQMPWEERVLVNQEDYDTYSGLLRTPPTCDCGGEKSGGAHSTWCSKESK